MRKEKKETEELRLKGPSFSLNKTPWTKREEKFLKENYKEHKIEKIAKELRRSVSSCYGKARLMGIIKNQQKTKRRGNKTKLEMYRDGSFIEHRQENENREREDRKDEDMENMEDTQYFPETDIDTTKEEEIEWPDLPDLPDSTSSLSSSSVKFSVRYTAYWAEVVNLSDAGYELVAVVQGYGWKPVYYLKKKIVIK